MQITNDIRFLGVNDRKIDLFEGQYRVPNGMAYNSYAILDEKVAIFDTVDANFKHEWLDNIEKELGGRKPDYLIVQHMEPDHSANIDAFLKLYPNVTVVASAKAFAMMKAFFGSEYEDRRIVAGEGSALSLGRHELQFITAPMVHWPEVLMTYDKTDKVLFSADAFGKFGAFDADEPWDDEARRYYFGIVGKYGAQVQNVLKKAAALEIRAICPTHGPVLSGDLSHYLKLYDLWSRYESESTGAVIAYTSVYGNTAKAVKALADKLLAKGCPKVTVYDLARCDMAQAIADAFRCDRIVLATTTYNADIFPPMRRFLEGLAERNFQKRTVAFIENGSWAPLAAKIMKEILAPCKDLRFAETSVRILSALADDSKKQLDALADELTLDYQARDEKSANKNDPSAMFKIGYGLYVVTTNDGKKDNGLIVNTVAQIADNPLRIAVNINKANYSHHIVQQTKKLNVNVLSVDAPFDVFKNFGFQSGRVADKFAGWETPRTANGLIVLPKYINAVMSLEVEQYVDLGSHGMFICSVAEARVLSDRETMTYSYYQSNVKPKPQTEGKKGWVCKICGYIYEGDPLPEDFICPLCKHPASDFEPIK